MLCPSRSSARRSSRLLRMASAPTSRAGSTMREKPNRSFRWKVTRQRYRENGRSLELVDRPERPVGADPRAAVAHARLDQRVAGGRDRALGVGRFHRPGHPGLEALLGLGQLLFGQAELLARDRDLLAGGGEVEHRLARLGFDLVSEIALADLLDLDAGRLLPRPGLPAEAIENRHREQKLHVVGAGEIGGVLAGIPVHAAQAEVGQVLLADRAERPPGGLGTGALGGQLGTVLPRV